MTPVTHEYTPDLSTDQLNTFIRPLLETQLAAERLLCRYVADLSDRLHARRNVLTGFSDIYHAARCLFGMSMRRTRECVRIGKALRDLPGVERAYLQGHLSYSRVREVTRVAHADDEQRWIRLAGQLPMRVLERRVAEAGGGRVVEERNSEPAQVTWATQDSVEVRLTLRPETWALLQRAMENARRAADSEALLTDGDALEVVARDALARQTDAAPPDLRRAVVLYECKACARTEIETGAGPIEVAPAAAAALACGGAVHDLATEGRAVERGGPLPAAIARAVRLRDRHRCRVPGCTRRRYVDVHHIEPRVRGGAHSRSNCLCLCDTHHRMLHEGGLVVSGDADGALEFRNATGERIVEPTGATASASTTSDITPDAAAAGGGAAGSITVTTVRATDASRAPAAAGRGATTQGGSPTHSGTRGRGESPSHSATPRGPDEDLEALPPESTQLLAVMGARPTWHVDDLCDATGLPPAAIASTLTLCELSGHVYCDGMGRYAAA